VEIERKFWLDAFPEHLPLVRRLQTWQGYLYTDPNEVRIRKSVEEDTGRTYYRLCIKSGGDLSRTEVETALSAEQFEQLCGLLEPGKKLIHKDYRAYRLEEGLVLECSIVDDGAFSYAEVEFESEAAAKAWQPPAFLGRETTYERGYKMKHYWRDRKL
jgi:CYTH domain-containing protein